MRKQITVDRPFLPYPTKEGGTPIWFTLWEGETILFKFYTFLNFREPEVWHYCDMTRWMGKTLTLEIESPDMTEEEFETIHLADSYPGHEEIYTNADRPQFHFTFRRGILNDPNALFYYNGVYHMFVQHQPYTNDWGDWQELCNFGWGHAVSTDLVHWKELPDEFIPDELGPAFSGTGFVDEENVSGLRQGEFAPILIYFTAAGGKGIRTMHLKHTQCLAYSLDGGKTFQKHPGNPIVPNYDIGNRDPKVLYHDKTGKWLMIIYTDNEEKYLILTSDDLFHFTLVSEYKWENGEHECPNMFEVPVVGENRKQMILNGVTGTYMAVDFDGRKIQPLTRPRTIHQGGSYQAMQIMPLPDGRLLSFYCYHYNRPKAGFSNCVGVPNELSLYHEGDEYILHTTPMRELEQLYIRREGYSTLSLDAAGGEICIPGAPLLDIEITVEAGRECEIVVQGVCVRVDGRTAELSVSPTSKGTETAKVRDPQNCRLRLLSDRNLLCLYEENSHIIMPMQVQQEPSDEILLRGEGAMVRTMEVRELSGIWPEAADTAHG